MWDFLYGILYGYFSFFALSWIFPYAVVTVRAEAGSPAEERGPTGVS